jgi:hypothetical protein
VREELEAVARDPNPRELYSIYRDEKGSIWSRGHTDVTLPPNTLITDATARTGSINALFPDYEIEVHEVNVARNAYLMQLDQTMSYSWIRENVTQTKRMIETVAGRHKHLAVFTTKEIRCMLTGESEKRLPVCVEALGAKIGHYGNLRGVDLFKDCDAVLILGRQEPRPEKVEEQT